MLSHYARLNKTTVGRRPCRHGLKERNVGPLHIAPGSPWENAYVESFNSRLRDEHLNREETSKP